MKLRNTILLSLIVPLFLFLGIIGSVSCVILSRTLKNEIHDRLDAFLSLQCARVQQVYEHRSERMSLLASRTQMRLSLDAYLESGDRGHLERLSVILEDAVTSLPGILGLQIVDVEGHEVGSHGTAAGEAVEWEALTLKRILEGDGSVQYFRTPTGELQLRQSIRLVLDDKVIGILVGIFDTKPLMEVVGNHAGLGRTGETLLGIMGPDNQQVFLTPLRFDPDAAYQLKTPRGGALDQGLLTVRPAFSETVDYRGKEVLSMYQRMPEENLVVAVKLDREEAYRELHRMYRFLSIFLGSVLVLGLIFASILSRFITRPLTELTDIAARMSEGDLSARLELRGHEEFKRMAEALNTMAGSLVEERHTLERRVLERTRKLEREIEHRHLAEQAQSEFLSLVSHELRTPITSIKGSVDILHHAPELLKDEDGTQLLDIATRNIERLLLLINDLLDIQQMESGNFICRLEEHDLCDVLKDALQQYRHVAELHDVTITCEGGDEPIQFSFDRLRIRQVIDNLLSNAVKYSYPGGTVSISVKKRKNKVELCVADQGEGIPTDFHPYVFERFAKARYPVATSKGGSGLGMNICKRIVDAHKGRIWFESSPGDGTIFFVELPASA